MNDIPREPSAVLMDVELSEQKQAADLKANFIPNLNESSPESTWNKTAEALPEPEELLTSSAVYQALLSGHETATLDENVQGDIDAENLLSPIVDVHRDRFSQSVSVENDNENSNADCDSNSSSFISSTIETKLMGQQNFKIVEKKVPAKNKKAPWDTDSETDDTLSVNHSKLAQNDEDDDFDFYD
uniref:Centrosomal protein kizuna n=1 Tax=Ciona savignyi TaxID=51511 RepID=H2YPR9_CIOSA